MIISGVAKPSLVVTHRLSFEAAPAASAKFDARADGYKK
jgi:hypothetical protein